MFFKIYLTSFLPPEISATYCSNYNQNILHTKVCFSFLPARTYRSILSASQTHQPLGQLPWPLTYFSRSFVVKILFFGLVCRIDLSQTVVLRFSSPLACKLILIASRTHQLLAGLPWHLTYFSRSFIVKVLFCGIVGWVTQEVLVRFSSPLACWWIYWQLLACINFWVVYLDLWSTF